jgi:hypothetical protein
MQASTIGSHLLAVFNRRGQEANNPSQASRMGIDYVVTLLWIHRALSYQIYHGLSDSIKHGVYTVSLHMHMLVSCF